jgi:alkylhydroperoxidase/carboxymuconolactone decarboxylase family protein YurZ
MAAGVAEDEIKHALLLLIPTAGFPAFMKSYAVLKGIE